MTPAERVAALELEFVRLKERADYLDRSLQGHPDAWLEIVARMPPTVAEVVVDRVLSEARQGALAMATIAKTLAAIKVEEKGAAVADPLDEIKKKREDNERAAAERLARTL